MERSSYFPGIDISVLKNVFELINFTIDIEGDLAELVVLSKSIDNLYYAWFVMKQKINGIFSKF